MCEVGGEGLMEDELMPVTGRTTSHAAASAPVQGEGTNRFRPSSKLIMPNQ
jgi:hypothetical protein